MKKLKFVLAALIILGAFSGCPSETSEPEPQTPKPVAGIVIKDGETTLPQMTLITVKVGDPAKNLDLSVTPAGAETADGFTVSFDADERTEATFAWNPATKKITITPVSETASDITVAVKAKNNLNTLWVVFNLKVKVNGDSYVPKPVENIVVKEGEITLDAASIVEVMVGGQAKNLDVSVTPAEAASVTGFSVTAVSSDPGKANAAYNSSAKTISITPVEATTSDLTITVTAQNNDNTTPVTASFKVKVNAESGIEPTGIELTQTGSSTLVNNTTINVNLEQTGKVQLFAKVLPEDAMGTVSWFSGDPNVAAVDDNGLVKLLNDGTTLITASVAEVTASVTVEAAIDPNIIFLWSHERNGEPEGMGNWQNGANNNPPFSGSHGTIPGFGKQSDDIPISISTAGNAGNEQISYNGGIILDASSGTSNLQQKVISIGLATGRAPLTTDTVHPAGVFDFRNGIPANSGIKVTVTGSIEKDSDPGNMRISLNNNSQNAGTAILKPQLTSRLFYTQPVQDNSEPASGMLVRDGSKVTAFIGNIFRPSDFTDGLASLETAHISISITEPTVAGAGAKIKVTGIRIEYVPAGSVDITIDPEADFAGFPENIDLSKTGSPQTMTISLEKFTSAEWFIDGVSKSTSASYVLDAAVFKTGDHSLTVLVTINGHLYSKSVTFTVAE